MIGIAKNIDKDFELQQELSLQYEAILEEMRYIAPEFKAAYLARASSILRDLSQKTRETATELRLYSSSQSE